MITKSHTLNVKVHSRIEPHLDVELQNEVEVHCNFEISVHERDAELPDKEVHSDLEVERPNAKARAEPRLSKLLEMRME